MKVKRRSFMGVIGGSCAVITAAALVKHEGADKKESRPPRLNQGQSTPKKVKEGEIKQISTDVLVVGGGMAGVFAAIKAHDNGAKVIVVDKGAVGKSGQTPFARGIFRYDEKESGISKADYLAKTAAASQQMNNPVYTSLLLDQSAAYVDELDSWGFFDQNCYANAMNRPLKNRQIPVYERVMLTNLLEKEGRVVGAMGISIDKCATLVFHAKSVVLCTGASGFKPTGWQIGSLTSDGDAMAYRIGAEITGKEWNDGHSRTNPGLEGLCRVTGASGNIQGMLGVEENVMVSKTGPGGSMRMGPPPGADGRFGPLGKRPVGPHETDKEDERRGPPPGVMGKESPRGGPPPGESPTSIGGCSAGMSIHKAEGLFPANGQCASNIPGLYAAGDALGSMQTGGIYTQVGSSLAGSAIQGGVAGKAAAEFTKSHSLINVSADTLKRLNSEIYAPLLRTQGFSPQWVTQTMQGIMIPNFILYVKSAARIEAALTYLEYLRDHQVPLLMANDLHELRQAHETANMILNAEMKLRASLMRTESRGSHYREDFPRANDSEWLCWIKIFKGKDGRMKLAKHKIEGES